MADHDNLTEHILLRTDLDRRDAEALARSIRDRVLAEVWDNAYLAGATTMWCGETPNPFRQNNTYDPDAVKQRMREMREHD